MLLAPESQRARAYYLIYQFPAWLVSILWDDKPDGIDFGVSMKVGILADVFEQSAQTRRWES